MQRKWLTFVETEVERKKYKKTDIFLYQKEIYKQISNMFIAKIRSELRSS